MGYRRRKTVVGFKWRTTVVDGEPWSRVELATSSFRWLRTGPPTECGSRVPIKVLQTDGEKRLHSDEVHPLRN